MKRAAGNTLFTYFKKMNKNQPSESLDDQNDNENLLQNVNMTQTFVINQEALAGASSSTGTTSTYDIAKFIKQRLSNSEKLDLVAKFWIPDDLYNFPTTTANKQNRRFQVKWLKTYQWLTYSASLDAAFCKFCVLFAKEGVGYSNSQDTGKLVKLPFRNWKDALELFKRHSQCKYHIDAVSCYEYLKKEEQGNNLAVSLQINKAHSRQVKENQQILIPIIETVILCGRNGWALRGHRDSGSIDVGGNPVKGEGNFRALLRYKMESGDEKLRNHLLTCKKNASYISWDIQNQIIDCCNTIILRKLVTEINKAKCFAVLADETADISCIEEYSICARYYNEDTETICEHFLQFVPVVSVTGKSLATTLLISLEKFGLDLKYLRGQGYDGAPVNTGEKEGVQAYVRQKYPTAIFVHCVAHSLNLVLSKSSTVRDINNCFGLVEKIYAFFETPMRNAVLSEKINEFAPEIKRQKL